MADALHQRKLPFNVRKRPGGYKPAADAIQIMTMKVSKGLEFPVVALPCVGHMPAKSEYEQEAARLFYVAATRATQRLVIGVGRDEGFGGVCRFCASVLTTYSWPNGIGVFLRTNQMFSNQESAC